MSDELTIADSESGHGMSPTLLGAVRRWSIANRVLLVIACVLPIMFAYAAVGYYGVARSDLFPFADRDYVRGVMLPLHAGVFIPAWITLLTVSLVIRHRRSHGRGLAYALSILWFGCFGVCSYFFGSHTSMFPGFIVFGGAAFGLALFDRRPVILGLGLFFVIITLTTVAEQLRFLPYAPFLLHAPFEDQRLALSWLLSAGTIDFFSVLTVLLLIDYVMNRWKQEEKQLVHTSDQLGRANDIISRYVASQLAQKILAGEYDGAEEHTRRRLTLFFSDIKGFAETADMMEPEDLSQMLNEYLSEMALIAERYAGTIDKFIGDAVMVFFGAPATMEARDQALRAVRMAMDMQERVAALRSTWQRKGFVRPFHIRIGINTGQASIGSFGSKGRMDYTAVGRQVNLAARLQAHCEPGKILLSHSAWVLVEDTIACTPKGELQVKGIHTPVKVYEVVATETDGETRRPFAT